MRESKTVEASGISVLKETTVDEIEAAFTTASEPDLSA
jgi:hypothetical protein